MLPLSVVDLLGREGNGRFPDSPFARAGFITEELRSRAPDQLYRATAVDGAGVIRSGDANYAKTYPGLVATEDSELGTVRIHSRRGRVPPGSRSIVVAVSGTGAATSHAGSTLDFAAAVESQGATNWALKLGNIPWQPTAVETVDLPFHGVGTRKVTRLDELMDWMYRWLAPLRATGLPVHVVARSASPALFAEFNRRHPGIVSKFVFVGMLHPQPELGFLDSLYDHIGRAYCGECLPANDSIDWLHRIYEELWLQPLPWWRDPRPFGDVPTLILVGKDDPEVSARARVEFRAWSMESEGRIRFREIPKAKHNVFSGDGKNARAVIEAFEELYGFIR